jgi:CheY-like chemotaxis protein
MRTACLATEGSQFLSGLWRLIAPAPRRQPAADLAVPANGKKVLIVDDDAVIRTTTSRKLRAEGYTVVTAEDCSEAIGAVRDERPDLILLDLTFPPNVAHFGIVSWDGFDFVSWLRQFQHTSSIPILILTLLDTPTLEARALKAGARGLFRKPVDHERLLETINHLLGVQTEAAQVPVTTAPLRAARL